MRPLEIALHHYPHACAMCDCEPTHTWSNEPCISVRRVNYESSQIDRCMECGQRWPAASSVQEAA